MAKLWENTEALEAILETLQTKAAGGGNSKPILYGTYVLAKEIISFPAIADIDLNLADYSAYGHFYDGEQYSYRKIKTMWFSTAGGNLEFAIVTDTNPKEQAVHFSNSETKWWWGDNINGGDIFYDDDGEQYRLIDFKEPVEVEQKFYDQFMQFIDLTETTPYDIGRESVIADGGAAEITYDSTYKTLTITTE